MPQRCCPQPERDRRTPRAAPRTQTASHLHITERGRELLGSWTGCNSTQAHCWLAVFRVKAGKGMREGRLEVACFMVMYVKWMSLGRTRPVPCSLWPGLPTCPELLLRSSSVCPFSRSVCLSVCPSASLFVCHSFGLSCGRSQANR